MSDLATLSTFSLDIPRRLLLTANQRLHWAEKARRTTTLRLMARAAAGNGRVAFTDRVRCEVLVSWPDKRRRDVENISPTLKAAIDGAVDAGLLQDDSDRHLVGPDKRVSDELCDKQLACTLLFQFEAIA